VLDLSGCDIAHLNVLCPLLRTLKLVCAVSNLMLLCC
jgi:hypothetical protein